MAPEDREELTVLVFEVNLNNEFKFVMPSSTHFNTTSYSYGGEGYDGFCWIQVENQFAVSASDISLRHTVGVAGAWWERKWGETIQSGQSTSQWLVYFKTGLNSPWDYWNISVLRKGDKDPHKNAKVDKQCNLQEMDRGKSMKLKMRNEEWETAWDSGSCTDKWDWKPKNSMIAPDEDSGKAAEDDWSTV